MSANDDYAAVECERNARAKRDHNAWTATLSDREMRRLKALGIARADTGIGVAADVSRGDGDAAADAVDETDPAATLIANEESNQADALVATRVTTEAYAEDATLKDWLRQFSDPQKHRDAFVVLFYACEGASWFPGCTTGEDVRLFHGVKHEAFYRYLRQVRSLIRAIQERRKQRCVVTR